MKFGEQLRQSLVRDHYYYYISYDELKTELKRGIAEGWNNQLEEEFVAHLEAELDKVFTFQKVKSNEISRRIKDADRDVNEVVKLVNQGQQVADEEFEYLEDEVSDVIADVHDLAKFTRLNYTGFQKIIKKHDKVTSWTLRPIFAVRLNAKPFFKENYDLMIVQLSRLYDLVRTRGNPVKGDSSSGGSQQNFVRQTTKYWVHPDNITELKLIILKHLPVLVFNANKEFEIEDSAITSIYYDNKPLDLYRGRLEKTEGAEAIRLRWYGGMNSDTIFVERKTHREDWTGEKSVKARFALKEKYVNDFMAGTYTVEQAFAKMRRDGKKSIKEIESLEALAREVQYTVIKDRLRPVVRSFYNRTAFQLPGDARVRISLDTELSMVREDDFDGLDRTGGNWRRMDIGVDWPFPQLPPQDLEKFPYAVLEVKLQTQMGQEPPAWVRELVSSHLVEAVPKFSKFIHGTATLLPDMVNLIPFWLPQMDVDIRKPKTYSTLAIEHTRQADTEFDDDDDDDEDSDDLAEYEARAANGNVQDEEEAGERRRIRFASANEVVDESTSLLNNRTRSTRHKYPHLIQAVVDKVFSLNDQLQSFFGEHSVSTVPPGTVFIEGFKIPEGKRLCVPVRIEPKVYFANERTFLNWIEIGILLGAMASGLLNYGNPMAVEASLGFFITALICIFYSIGLYLWRVKQIRAKKAVRYDDQFGPALICVSLAAATGMNFIMHLTS